MKELYLIRHGRTEANEQHQYCGASDLPLSEAGAAELAKIRYDIPTYHLLTSGMKRTEQTLQLLFGDLPHDQDIRFREICFGDFELYTYDQLKDSPAYQQWIQDDGQTPPPRGESFPQFRQRVLKGLRELLKQKEPVTLVTHGGVIALIMEQLFPDEGKKRYQWQPQPGGGYKITSKRYEKLEPLERSNCP